MSSIIKWFLRNRKWWCAMKSWKIVQESRVYKEVLNFLLVVTLIRCDKKIVYKVLIKKLIFSSSMQTLAKNKLSKTWSHRTCTLFLFTGKHWDIQNCKWVFKTSIFRWLKLKWDGRKKTNLDIYFSVLFSLGDLAVCEGDLSFFLGDLFFDWEGLKINQIMTISVKIQLQGVPDKISLQWNWLSWMHLLKLHLRYKHLG